MFVHAISLCTFGLDSIFLKRGNKFDHHGGVIINFPLVYELFFLNYVRDFWLQIHFIPCFSPRCHFKSHSISTLFSCWKNHVL
jgi:hypothetical protein